MRRNDNRPRLVFSYWENGQMLCKGTVRDIADFKGVKDKTIYNMAEKGHPRLKLEGRMEQVYEIYTKDGAVIFKGNARECEDHLFIARGTLKHILQGIKTGKRNGRCGAYLVRRKGMELCRLTN